MKPKTFKKLIAAAIVQALVLTSFGPAATQALAQELQLQNGGARLQPSPIQPLGGLSAPLRQGVNFGLSAPQLRGGLPSLSAPAPKIKASVSVQALPESKVLPSVPAVASAEQKPFSVFAALTAPKILGQEQGGIPKEALTPGKEVMKSDSSSREWADKSFRYLKGESDSAAVPTTAGVSAPRRSGLGKVLAVLGFAGASVFSIPAVAQSNPKPQVAAVPAAPVPHGILGTLGGVGHSVGNGLAFVFPLFQIRKTFIDGHSKNTPFWPTMMLATASLVLGLVSATLKGDLFWGAQNLFGGLASLAVIPLGKWLSKRGKTVPAADHDGPTSILHDPAWKATALAAAVIGAASVALYFIAAPLVPALLAKVLTAAGISKLKLVIQIVTGAMYLAMFYPAIKSIITGKAANGFTPGFSMTFFICSTAFVVWLVKEAIFAAPRSPERMQYGIYAALNVAYAVVALASYVMGRRQEKRPAPLAAHPEAPPNGPPVAAAAPQAVESPREAPGALARKEGTVLPKDAADMTAQTLLAEKAEAQERARQVAKDARLVRVTINLDDPRAHWAFVFHSNSRRKVLTVWQKRIGIKPLPRSAPKTQALWDSRLAKLPDLKTALGGRKADRAEIRPQWKGDPIYVFLDKDGNVVEKREKLPEAPKPEEPAKTPPPPQQLPQPPPPDRKFKWLHEDFLGFRWAQGIKQDPTLKPLPADAKVPQIIDQISRQFAIPRDKVVSMAAGQQLYEHSPRRDWLAVYDRLQAANREHFKNFDHKKYQGWSSFRELANREYPPGWRGVLLRTLEVHKHFIGFFVRFPYHLFDMFLFGYFRQNISFEFRHSTEDFLNVEKTGKAEEFLKAALRRQGFKGAGFLGDLKANPAFRRLQRWFITPVAAPLATFVYRRLTLAVASAVAMGLLGAVAPSIPFLSFSLLAIPVLGPALVAAAHGLPFAVGAIPFVGQLLAPVVGNAAMALLKDMVVGPLLQTFMLSTLLTWPRAVGERVFKLRSQNPTMPFSWLSPEAALAAVQATFSKSFWVQNLKSFVGMATVGAEIEGIMTYAGGLDHALSGVIHHDVHLFESIGAAVERPKGQSPIPFGGAITWGGALLYKAQTMLGFNLSDWVMHAAVGFKGAVHESATDAALAGLSAQAVVHAASARADQPQYKFDPDLYKKSPAEVEARIKELAGKAGNLQEEIRQVKLHMGDLAKELAQSEARLAELKKQSRPITREEREEYERLLKELSSKRSEAYIQSKLAEIRDLKSATPEALERLRYIQKLQQYYDAKLVPPTENPGQKDDLAVAESGLKAMLERLSAASEGRTIHHGGSVAAQVDKPTLDRLNKLIAEIEDLRTEAKAEMTNRDAVKKLLAVENQERNRALKARRDGKDMLSFHKNVARLATVMDLALSLNEIGAAENAINGMEALLNKKIAKIQAAEAANQQNQAASAAQQAQVAQWNQQAQQTLSADKAQAADIANFETEAGMATARIGAFKSDVSAFIAQVNAQDGGKSGDAATEYQRRINLLPTVINWETSGNPNDPSQFSLKQMQDYLTLLGKQIPLAEQGVTQLQGAPLEFAGVAIIAVPGPQVNVTNPSQAQVLQILSDRRVYWDNLRAGVQTALDGVNRRLDPSNTRMMTDPFGDSAPESLPIYRAQEVTALAASQSYVQQATAKIDAMAAQINTVTGANLPPLSGLSLTDLQTAFQTYGDKLKTVKIPAGETPDLHLAQMNLVGILDLLPQTGRNIILWSKADGTIKTIDDALTNILPITQTVATAVVGMLRTVVSDVDLDKAYVTNGGDPQALLNRKINLLQNVSLPVMKQAQDLLQRILIPFQQKTIATAQPNTGDYYKLFNAQLTLINQTKDLYNNILPWAIASKGAPQGDQGTAHARIAAFRAQLQQNLTGYDDANGVHHQGINEAALEIQHRVDPNYSGTESVYGEIQPYSLPKKISQYTAERAQRAAQLNSQGAEINGILTKIQNLSKGKYNLSSYMLPTNVTSDKAGAAAVQALVDNNTLQNLADQLKTIGTWADSQGGSISIGNPNSTTPPSGTQPPITLNDYQTMALLSKDAAVRLVPSSVTQPQTAPEAYGVARFLYSDGVVNSATDALNNQIPPAQKFVNEGTSALNDAIADTVKNDAYVSSNGTAENADQVYNREVANFAELDGFLKDGLAFFGLKQQWDQNAFNSITKINTYYNSLTSIYQGGVTADQTELLAAQKMMTALQNTYNGLEASRRKVSGWMAQLNDPHDSALRRINEDLANLQQKTRAVLEENVKYHDLNHELDRSNDILRADLTRIQEKQEELKKEAVEASQRDGLPPDLVARIDALKLYRGSWEMDGDGQNRQAQTLVVKKSEYAAFVDAVLGLFKAQDPTQDLSQLRSGLMSNPQGLTRLIPDSQMLDFGDTADGFYMIYQSQFSTPGGLETSNWVTLGNIGKVWGNNVSVNGYAFGSPSNPGNAGYGDKGVEVQIESLQGDHVVNYLDVDFHRVGTEAPGNDQFMTSTLQSRLLLFDDYAMMLMGDRLYVGLAGFGDFAMSDAANKPSYYGGNAKASLKLTEVMSLNAEQQEMFAHDPRTFLQQVNLDFTGYDPDLNHTWNIAAKGDNKHYSRTQIGPSFNIGKLMESKDAFTVDVFYANSGGTDDITQKSIGTTIVKGFSIHDDSGKTWLQINNQTTGELGQQFNTLKDRLSFTLPNQGIVISGEGQILGSASAYYGEVAKKVGDHSQISASYGSPYVGMNDRLTLSFNSSFTLGELWNAVVGGAAQNLQGGETLKGFNKDMSDFFKGDGGKPSRTVSELERVFEQDVARKLVTQDIGTLSKEIAELRKAGAILDNTRMRGMVGFVSAPISNDPAELATGGGFTTGVNTDITLNKTQKALIEAKAQTLYREGLRLQTRLIELTQQWQAAIAGLAQAQWDLKMARFEAGSAPSAALRQEGEVRVAEATERLHEALLRYNALSGRDPDGPVPFDDLNAGDLAELMGKIKGLIAAPDRLGEILHALDPDTLKAAHGEDPFNLLDWIPWVDRFTFNIGAQLQDGLAGQQFGVGGSLRLPFYNPKQERDHAYVLEGQAAQAEMAQAYADFRLAADKQVAEAQAFRQSADAVRPGVRASADELANAIRGYRNNLVSPAELRQAFANWTWYAGTLMDAESKGAVAQAASQAGEDFVRGPERDAGTVRITSLEDAVKLIQSQSLKEVALRQEAAAAMTEANDRRIEEAFVDLYIGANLTVTGVALLPVAGITGIPVMPVFGFKLKPQELMVLQGKQGKGEAEYYQKVKTKIETGLALEFYQNLMAAHVAGLGATTLKDKVIPQLERALADAQARGAAQTEVLAASKRLDEARLRLDQARLAERQAESTLNYLLGRSADSPLQIQLGSDEALASITRLLRQAKPVENQENLLASRVQVAQAVETMVDKNLKVEQLYLEPISLSVRSLGRLISALSGDGISNPDLAAAARVQTLTEQRAQANFDQERRTQVSRLRAQLAAAEEGLKGLQNKNDPESELARYGLLGRIYAVKANLAALEKEEDQEKRPVNEDLPTSYEELTRRLAQRQQALSNRSPEAPVEVFEPETVVHQSEGFARYYHAVQTLSKAPINKDYLESWVEVRLKSQDTPPEVLLALSKLRAAKADRQYRNAQEGAAAKAEILSASFAADVQLLRWAERESAGLQTRLKDFPKDQEAKLRLDRMQAFEAAQDEKLKPQRDEIVALLNLAPETGLQELEALVPESRAGPSDLRSLAQGLIDGIRAKEFDRIKTTLFEGGLPEAFGNEDGLINQIKANTLAERMSYKGFTPVAAFGLFRGKFMSGGFMEAPDPRAIESGLESILSDAVRKELISTGKLQELTLNLHLEMTRVSDGEKLVEERWRNIQAAESDYRAQLGLAKDDVGSPEVAAAQARLVAAWSDFTDQMIRTKGDFITLVTELEALGEGAPSPIRRASSGVDLDWQGLHRDPTAELLSYWSQRVLDPAFVESQSAALERMGPGVTAKMKQALADDIAVYARARDNDDGVRHADFDSAERLQLLVKVDLEGRRQAVEADLAAILRAAGLLNPAVVGLLTDDLKSQLESKKIERAGYEDKIGAMRQAYWSAAPAPMGAEGAFARLEELQKEQDDARQLLLDSYLRDLDETPSHFVLKDAALDGYLEAQRRFDDKLIATLDASEVKNDPQLVKTLNGLYDIRAVFEREAAGAQSGRGRSAIDALVMLEEARLAGARWSRRPPEEIGRIAEALENLREMRERWSKGTSSLEPLYAVTKIGPDGKRLWTIEDWLTKSELQKKRDAGLLDETKKDHIFLKDGPYEVIGGVDVAAAVKDDADAQQALNDRAIRLHERMEKFDFAVVDPAEGGAQGFAYDQLFAPGGLLAQGKVLFFNAPLGGADLSRLHDAVPALTALRRAPEKNAIYVYTGSGRISRDRFPTLESLIGSELSGDFKRVEMSAAGAEKYADQAKALGARELRQGWVELKLNGYGFARDAQGQVVDLYQSEKDYEAAKDGFLHAGKILADAQSALAQAQRHEAEAKSAADDAKAAADAEGLKYQDARARISKSLLERLERDQPRRDGESEQIYQARLKIALDAELAKSKEFKEAQKRLEPAAKKYTDANKDYKEASAKVENAKKGVADAELNRQRSKEWSLYLSRDVALALGKDNSLLGAAARPDYGGLAVNEKLGDGVAVKTISGDLLAVEFGDNGELINPLQSADQVAKAAETWTIKSVALGGDSDVVEKDGTVRPTYRLSHYEDGGKAVLLNRRYLIEMAEAARSKAGSDPHWGLMPWNWGNLLLELPRGVVNTPTELLTGRDPNQQHYLGRVNMYKLEGGETEHHGFFRKVLGFVDVLDFLPDPVDRYFDPSQFPNVQLDSKVLPGQNVFSKDMRNAKGDRDIHMGAKAAETILRHTVEDLVDSRNMTLGRFQGGVDKTVLETKRGRGGIYGDSKKTSAFGDEAVGDALNDALASGTEDKDGVIQSAANPGNIEVDKVEARMRIRPGALQYGQEAAAVGGYSDRVSAAGKTAREQDPILRKAQEEAKKDFDDRFASRRAVDREEAELWRKFHEIEWRIGQQEALEKEIGRLESRIADLKSQLAWWGGYLKKLEDALRKNPGTPGDPNDPQNPNHWPLPWLLILWLLAALIAAIWWWLRRGKPMPLA